MIINAVSPGERILYLETKSSKPSGSKVVKLGSKNWLCRPIYFSSGISHTNCCFWVFTASFFCVNKRHDNTSQFHECYTFPHSFFIYYFGYKIKFLGQNKNKNIVCDTKTVNNAFNKSTDGGAGRNVANREGRPIFILCIHSRDLKKKNRCPLNNGRSPVESSCHQVAGWVLLGDAAILGTQLWSMPLTCWHVGPSAITARATLVKEHPCCWTHV